MGYRRRPRHFQNQPDFRRPHRSYCLAAQRASKANPSSAFCVSGCTFVLVKQVIEYLHEPFAAGSDYTIEPLRPFVPGKQVKSSQYLYPCSDYNIEPLRPSAGRPTQPSQYLYFCTSKASKLRTVVHEARRGKSPCQSANRHP